MPVWKQRRQGQSTERQKLKFFLLLSLRFTTMREFPSWCLVLSCATPLKEKVHVALCLLMLTSYQNPADHLVASQGAMVVLEKKHCHPAPGHFRLKTQKFPVTLSALALPVQKIEMIFPPLPPTPLLLCIPCPWLVSSFKQEQSAMTCMYRVYHNQAIFQLRYLLDMMVI